MIKIGSQTIDTNIFLAPMSGCTDLPFRLIAREHGARFAFLEMLDANSFQYDSRRTYSMMRTCPGDSPLAAQIVGNEPESMIAAAEKVLASIDAKFLDVNAACPARKVLKKRAGAYLMRDQTMLYRIIKRLAGGLRVPVTVKLRLGYDKETADDLRELAVRCEGSGASAIFIHGRKRLQYYAGDIDYAAIKAVKESVGIPVFGSGNIFSPQMASRMLDETGCDGILVARGAFGNPWIFEDIDRHLRTGELPSKRSLSGICMTLRRHIGYVERFNQSRGKIGVMRKVIIWYLRAFPSARRMRGDISLVKSYEKVLEFIDRMERAGSHDTVEAAAI
jgi:nifR3 family TIM-barrel protein